MKTIKNIINQPISIAPLVVYRILFGCMVLYGALWSIWKNDIQIRFLEPTFFFKYWGFEWVGFIGEWGIYAAYAIWILSAIGIILGAFYRWASWSFFIVFTYLQLLDATNYINHYYAISILGLFLALLPAHSAYSIDVWRKPALLKTTIPYLYIVVFQLQFACIYTFAAIAKMNTDWMIHAMPLKIWLLQSQDFPLIGWLFAYHTVHVAMSWIGLLFDLTIVWWLWYSKTRVVAYIFVLIFHVITGLLLNIGLFPMVMITGTTLFFSPEAHQKVLSYFGYQPSRKFKTFGKVDTQPNNKLVYFFVLHFIIQIALPLRHYVLYTGNPIWTEEGYNFSWWVMLVEKDGVATFYIEDPISKRVWEVDNNDYLTPFQEKRMAVRPDHILQYAHYLAKVFQQKEQIKNPIVRAEVHVSLNGRVSQVLIDPTVNLALEKRSIWQASWILPYTLAKANGN